MDGNDGVCQCCDTTCTPLGKQALEVFHSFQVAEA